MPIIKDLEITRQLLPLINFTHNRFAQEMLTGILQDLPPDEKGVMEKQLVIRRMIDNGYVHTKLDYNRPVFSYRLQSGWSELKIGKIIFEQEACHYYCSGRLFHLSKNNR